MTRLLQDYHKSDWEIRKEARRKEFQRRYRIKQVTCTACSGSGRYDHNGSPKCGCCNGTGKTFPYHR